MLTAKCKCYEGADATGAADEKRLRDRAPANQQHAACSFHLMVQLTNVGSVGWHRIELELENLPNLTHDNLMQDSI